MGSHGVVCYPTQVNNPRSSAAATLAVVFFIGFIIFCFHKARARFPSIYYRTFRPFLCACVSIFCVAAVAV